MMKRILTFLALLLVISWQSNAQCDAQFDYGGETTFCTNGTDPSVAHTTGDDGDYTATPAGLSLNALTGAIDLSASTPGNYTVTNTVSIDGEIPNMIITAVFDGPLSGGTPKGVELFVLNDIADLSLYGIGSANNGGGSDGQEFTFPAEAATAGDFIYVATEESNFTSYFGFAPNYTDGAVSINGDDAVELFQNGSVIDLYGDINTDGTGQPWEHLDGWAYRNSGSCPTTNFSVSDWTLSGPNALDGQASNIEDNGSIIPTSSFAAGQTACLGQAPCIAVVNLDITINAAPEVNLQASGSNSVCGLEPITVSETNGTAGSWSGGAGTFADAAAASTTYTPDASEAGTSVVLTYTATETSCGTVASELNVAFIEEIPSSEFSYANEIECPQTPEITPIFEDGEAGTFTYSVVSGGTNLDIDAETGVITPPSSDNGVYEVTNTQAGFGELMITGVIDGPLSGGVPKAIELLALNDIADLSIYSIGVANNGGGSDGPEFQLSGSIAQGEYLYIATEETGFMNYFGFAPNIVDNIASINGDDAIELFQEGLLIDAFGDVELDGSGEPWEYKDGWAYRMGDALTSSFDISQWSFSGPDAIDGETDNGSAANPFPIGTFSTSFEGICPGNSTTVTIEIGDNEDPVVDCPNDILIVLEPGKCSELSNWQIEATDNCGLESLEQTEGPESGSYFDVNTVTTISYLATDVNGNTTECSFTVTVEPYPNPVSSLTCNGDLNISVNLGCAVELNADMFLEGGPYTCYNLYEVAIDPFQTGEFTPLADMLNDEGQLPLTLDLLNSPHDYKVTDPATGNSCWGTLVFEDKFEVIEFECPADTKLANCSDSTPTNPDVLLAYTGACAEGITIQPVLVSSNEPECGDSEYVYEYTYNGEVLCTQTVLVTSDPLGFMAPEPVVELPCGTGWSPAEIADYFDVETPTFSKDVPYNPAFCPIDGVRENHEGYRYAYIHYYTQGCGNYADGRGDGVPAGVAADEHPQKVDNNVCSFYATYSDQVLPACAPGCHGNQKIIRTWTMIDWCNPSAAPIVFTQVIKVVDRDAPTIDVDTNNPQTTQVVSVNPWSCAGDFALPHPDVLHDDCTDDVTYSVSGPGNVVYDSANGRWVVSGAPLGENVYTYTAVDCCGNEGTDTYIVSVVDRTPPVPVATQNIVVNLTSAGGDDGIAKIFVESVNNGSYDGCTGVGVEIRRETEACDYEGNDTYNVGGDFANDEFPSPNIKDIDNGQWVKVCCDDLTEVDADGNAYGIVKVMMRVYDDANGDGVYGTAGDNFNETWVDVRVEKKITPSIICPPDVTLACDMDYTNQDMLGYPTTFSTCGTEAWEVNFSGSLNSCGEGTIRATYSLVNLPSVKCTQRIRVENPYDAFDGSTIRFPRDKTTDCMGDTDPEAPTWTEGPCDFIGYTVDSDTYVFEEGQAGEDACMKVVHTYTVIDWCQYDESNGAEGTWTDIQIYKIVDDEAPVLDCQDSMFDVDANCERSSVTLTNTAVDNGDCASAWLKWQVFVDTWGDGSDDWEFSSFVPTSSTFNNGDTNGNGVNDMYIAPTASGDELSITIPEVMASSMNNHRVVWKVTDGCGNVTQCESTYMVVDKKAPTPYCVNLSTALMENGMVEIWAIDFDLGAFDNCTAQENLRFTFSEVAPEEDSSYDSASRSSAMTFTECSPNELVKVYVWDEKGNSDFCTVNLRVSGVECESDAGSRIAGNTMTESGNGLMNASVKLENMSGGLPNELMTDEIGHYVFNDMLNDYDYTITVEKNDDVTNGVSTLDLVLIQRHILAYDEFTSPYTMVAADINSDKKISSADIVELRKVVLGIQDEFNENTSWRFIDSEQEFADTTNPWPLDESRYISSMDHDMMAQDFVAVKIGDVNGNADMNVAGEQSEVRSGTTMVLETAEQTVAAGETVQIAISSADFAAVAGYQMTVEFNGLTFVGVEGSAINLNASNVGVISDNVVTMSWSTMDAVSSTDELFVINAIAEKPGNVSNMIKVSDRVIASEAYVGNNLDIHTVALAVRGAELPIANTLMQNEPNPFKQSTNISFELAQAGSATLTVMDVTGKVVRVVTGEYEAGMNTITLDKEDINTVGVLHYTLESGDFIATKKMIIIE